MFLSDAYVGGAAACDGGGWGDPKSRGAGDEERDCEVRDVRSFIRLVLRTWRNCSVISAANLSVSIFWCAERWALLLWSMTGRCELLVAVRLCAVVMVVVVVRACLGGGGGGGGGVGECSVYSVQDRLRIGSAQPDDAAAQQRNSHGAGILGTLLLSTVAEKSGCCSRRGSGAEDTQSSSLDKSWSWCVCGRVRTRVID